MPPLIKHRQYWQAEVDGLAITTGLHSILIMESLPDTMKVIVANSAQSIYSQDDQGSKSAQEGCHNLYCERVVNTGTPLFVADTSVDKEWQGNEDLVKFGLGTYYGVPLRQEGKVVGTVCALHPESFDFEAGSTSAKDRILALQAKIESDLAH
ncbi:GAF domain-containing protein [Pelagibaculum spongiae]|uniref:GAF domain-containing protein n=1 Tax=Pelagibaculum spongiae TaxID=2080658 RepID=A0A2V1H2T3_9GAMM|nr:GAF domain-containing protein [Pelagibaculum spongiae]PVZ69607.1 GAF domain-containing protein [Pelagibaculum spongiae]